MNAVADPAALLSTHDLGIAAGGRVLIEQASFAVRPGELWCVLGPNGSGKTSLLHVLAGVRPAQRGAVLLAGQPYAAHGLRAAARLRALLPQHQSDSFESSVLETVLLGRHPHVAMFGSVRAEDRTHVARAMGCMEVDRLAARDVRSLSGGERQRVALASTLAQDPALYLLDEPTAHLDLAHQVRLFRRLEDLARGGRGVVFATHEYNLAARFATHALLLTGMGRIQAGRASELLDTARLSAIFGFPLLQVGDSTAGAFVPRW